MAAAIVAHVPVEEYLSTVYKPDCDYVNGVVEERYLGETDHGWIQATLAALFRSHFKRTGLGVLTETRVQVTPSRFRVPDLIVTQGRPAERIIKTPPLLCIEILSPEDRWSRVTARIQEYLDFGVPEVWVVDPAEQHVWICKLGSIAPAPDPILMSGTDIQIPFSEIFE